MAENFLTILEKEKPDILKLLPESITPERWWALAVEVSKSRDLQRIAQNNPHSLIAALKKVCDWGLDLDGEEAIIVPYGDDAVPQAMYRGLIRRAIEAGAISHAVAEVIKDGDDLEIASGTEGRVLRHRPKFNLQAGKRAIVGAYAVFTLPNGTADFELMDADDLERVKKAALRMARRRKADAGLSPAWQEFEGEMAKKSVLRRGLKRFRGKRDSDAGRRLAETIVGTHFDAETEGRELPPDDLPNGADGVALVKDGVPPPSKTAPVSTIDEAVQQDVLRAARAKGLTMGKFSTLLYDQLGCEDLAEVRTDQIAAVMALIEG